MIENSGVDGKENEINNMVKEAYNNVPFYKEILLKKGLNIRSLDFSELPIVCKRDFLKSDYVNINIELLNKMPEVLSIMTSGTLGEPFEVKWNIVDERKSLLQLWLYRKKYYDISPSDRLCYFFPAHIERIETLDGRYYLAFSRKCIYDGSINKIYKQILDYNPKWMILQPSMALALCEQAEIVGKIPSELKYIECTGEELTDAIREKIKKIFKCAIANQYGCKEVGSIAYECPCGNMHIMRSNVLVEVDSDASDVYVTSLNNHVMPFIRYCTGDRGKLCFDTKCKCGNHSPILVMLSGRKNEYIHLKDGKQVHLYAVAQIISNINYLYNNCIAQYRLTQNDYDDFLLEFVMEDMCNETSYEKSRLN